MATGATLETTHGQQHDTTIGDLLPFSGLDQLRLVNGRAISRSQISVNKGMAMDGTMTISDYLAAHTKKSLRLRAKHVSDLKAFVDLPVELQLLVVEHLHPIDLYHFSRVSSYFRQLVMHPAARPVWKAAFMRHPDLPRPPPGVKESQWAFLIFGPGICGVCGTYGALTDFSIQKRFCPTLCWRAPTVSQRDFRDESNKRISSRHVIWALIPPSCKYIRRRFNEMRFLKMDFSIMWKKIQLIRILCENGLRFLSPLRAEYISARRAYIQKLNNSVEKCKEWAHPIVRQIVSDDDGLPDRLATKCQTRLRALGYDERDIGRAFDSIRQLLRQKAIHRLTRRVFREIKPGIEVCLRECGIRRIKNERRRLLLGIYKDYVKARSPHEWPSLPDVNTPSILDTGLFKRLLKDVNVDIIPGNVVSFFPEFIEEWIKSRREKFADILPEVPDETLEARVQRLELITSVVICGTCTDHRPLVGWKSILRHQLNSVEGCRKYLIAGHATVAAATSLVSSIGLDPLTAVVDDMNRDDRFVCGNCSPEARRGRLSRRAYTWLECLEHGIGDASHAKPAWLSLSPAAARFVRGHEKPYPDPSISVWRCNHCAHHFEKQVLQEDAIDHVKRVHCIRVPAIGVDVVVDLRKPIYKRREVFRLSLDPAYDHGICKHCSDVPIFKLWEKDVLMMHLIRRHHVPEPAEHVDWEAVPIILSQSAALVAT